MEGQGDLVHRLIIRITRFTRWVIGVTNLLLNPLTLQVIIEVILATF